MPTSPPSLTAQVDCSADQPQSDYRIAGERVWGVLGTLLDPTGPSGEQVTPLAIKTSPRTSLGRRAPAPPPPSVGWGLDDVETIVEHTNGVTVLRYRVKTVGPWWIEVIPQLLNWRIHTLRNDTTDPTEWSHRYWCYQGRSETTRVAALLAAAAWDGADHTEPVGWIKSWDGRHHGVGPTVGRRYWRDLYPRG